jgi:hypothetical protein
MTNFNWIVNALYTQTIAGEQDYVVIASFDVVGIDGEYTAKVTGTQTFSTESVSPFIPYEDLTNIIVVGWIQQDLGQDAIENIYSTIQGQIDSQINPPVVPQNTPLPPNFNN